MKIIYLFFLFTWLASSGNAAELDLDPYAQGAKGLQIYNEGEDYKEAAQLLQKALAEGHKVFAAAYADICKRELDGKTHKTSEAASWYIEAADAEDSDVYSYLHQFDPRLVDGTLEKSERIRLLKQLWRVEERGPNADYGWTEWIKGQHEQGARYLKRAAQGGHPLAQGVYAGICLQQSDEKFHTLAESAMWYCLAARGGDPDAFSYLRTCVPGFQAKECTPDIIYHLAGIWMKDQVLEALVPAKPSHINNYLIERHKLKIQKTSSQKIPFFFDLFVQKLFHKFGLVPQSMIDERPEPAEDASATAASGTAAKKVKTCREEASEMPTRSIISAHPAPWKYGVVYPGYHKQVETYKQVEIGKDEFVVGKRDGPGSALVKFLLDIYARRINNLKAGDWTRISHQEYPWMEAGIHYWKKKNNQRSFNFTSLTEHELLKRLGAFELIESRDLKTLLRHVEPEELWPRESERDIVQRFQEQSARSSDVLGVFWQEVKTHSFSYKDDKDLLKEPLLMHLVEDLTITNFPPGKQPTEFFSEISRYFTHLKKLKINFKKPPKGDDQILKIFKKLSKQGIEIQWEVD